MVNWVKLDRQRLVNKSIMMYKIVNNMVPEYLSSHFVLRSDTLTYNLRDSDGTLAIPQPRTNYCKRSLSYSGVVLWNSLPCVRWEFTIIVIKCTKIYKLYIFCGDNGYGKIFFVKK